MRSRTIGAALALLGLSAAPCRAEAPPSTGAMRHVLMLAGTIGARKSGSEADRRAVDYIAQEMQDAGLTVTRQEVPVVPYADGERTIASWNVVGELPGSDRDTVVVGAHHDSRGATVPGANDDASGVAVLLEVARAVARRPHRLTYRFISFCAEESGRLGSRFYVEHADLAPVRVMIALELVGRGELLVGPVPGAPPLWAQERLLRAAREERVRGVVARPLWTMAPRFLELPFGADHESFLDRGIPSFLVLGTFPGWAYHTREDGVGGVRAETLDRAVRLVDRVLRDMDVSVPRAEDDPHYLPLTMFGQGLLVPSKGLTVFSGLALLGWGILALGRVRAIASRRAFGETVRVLIVMGGACGLGLSGAFAAAEIMERVHRLRFPWMAHQGLHVAQAVACGLLTAWVGLNLFRRIKPTVAPGPYLSAAFLLPVFWVALALWRGLPEIAAFMAAPVLAFLASTRVESIGRKLAIGFLGFAPFLFLLTLRDYRALVDLGGVAPPGLALFALAFVVFFPLALYVAHVASFQDCLHSRAWWWLSGRWVGLGVLTLAAGLLAAGALRPAYDYGHRRQVRIRERIEVNGRQAGAALRSSDSLASVRLAGAVDRGFGAVDTSSRIEVPFPPAGISFEAATGAEPGSDVTLVSARVTAPVATDRVSYLFSSRSGFRVPGRGEEVRHAYTFTDLVPRRDPETTFRLRVPPSGDLAIDVRADFDEDLLGLRAVSSGAPPVLIYQASLEGSRHLLGPPAGAPAVQRGNAPAPP